MRRRSSVILILGALVCAGCSYSNESLIDPQYQTVYVEMFDNQSWYRGFEVGLTRELVNTINSRTHLRIVPKGHAQTIITGQISDYKKTVLTEDVDDNVRELQVSLVVDMTWSDRDTGRPIRVVRNFVRSEQIKRDLGETLETANTELFRDTAEELVERLEADW